MMFSFLQSSGLVRQTPVFTEVCQQCRLRDKKLVPLCYEGRVELTRGSTLIGALCRCIARLAIRSEGGLRRFALPMRFQPVTHLSLDKPETVTLLRHFRYKQYSRETELCQAKTN